MTLIDSYKKALQMENTSRRECISGFYNSLLKEDNFSFSTLPKISQPDFHELKSNETEKIIGINSNKDYLSSGLFLDSGPQDVVTRVLYSAMLMNSKFY